MSISTEYFGYSSPAHHRPGCKRADSRTWDVALHRDERFSFDGPGELRELVIRLVCTDCGVVELLTFNGESGIDPARRSIDTATIGWGCKAETVLGLYLWAGPPIWENDERGPVAFYVTRKPERPREPGDCAGIVTWQLGPRGGIKWAAGLRPTGHGTVEQAAPVQWSSRRSAVAWIKEQLNTAGGDAA